MRQKTVLALDFLIFDAFEDGVVLYSDMNMGRINEMLQKSKQHFRLERVKDGWKFDPVAAKAAGI